MSSLVFVLALASCQDKPVPPDAKWKADYTLTLEPRDGQWAFVVEGTTNMPKEAVLKARIYAVEIVDNFAQGRIEDEEPLVWEDDKLQPGFKLLEIGEGGRFKEDVYRFIRKPYALHYRARIWYRPRDNDDAVQKILGPDEFSRPADLKARDEKDLARQLEAAVQEVTADCFEIDRLFRELRTNFQARLAKPDPALWKAWKEPWLDSLDKVHERNETRFGFWAVWFERQAKMRLGGMCELLRRMLVRCGEKLDGKDVREDAFREAFQDFKQYFEDSIDALGIPFPLDPDIVGPAVADYDKALAALRAWAEKGGPGAAEAKTAARRDGFAALFRISPLLQKRKNTYPLVSEIGQRFRDVVDLVDEKADPAAVRKALEAHDALYKEFKRLSRLK